MTRLTLLSVQGETLGGANESLHQFGGIAPVMRDPFNDAVILTR
jgi:hypothetical protein